MDKQTAVTKLINDIKEARKSNYWGDSYILDWLLDIETQKMFIEKEREQTYRALAYYFHEHGKLTPNQYCREIYGGENE